MITKENNNKRSWYVIYVRSRHEKSVNSALLDKGIDTSLPMRTVVREWSDRKKKVQLPMFRGYVFVKINLNIDKLNVLQTPGIVKFIHFKNQIPTIPKEQIFWLDALVSSESEINYETQYLLGVEAEVVAGPFKGLKGKVIKQKSVLRVILWIDIIMQGISIEMDSADLAIEENRNKISQ